jgi:ppGpp synthetase/RelA/SpoT-type nucleotidyltranferase
VSRITRRRTAARGDELVERALKFAAAPSGAPPSLVASCSVRLPVSKGELNRLGDRLARSESPSEKDHELLENALSAYQDSLEFVKADLRGLDYAPTGRVKTTKTMVEKLQRTPGMQLSRVQDLAGARIMVRDFDAQDSSRDKISEFYMSLGRPCKIIDRRTDPRFGYRAVHLVVRIDEMPVEIQIRTELQDSWAQMVERLADRWGRGIRYGQEPEIPDARVRSGDSLLSRRDSVERLIQLGDSIYSLEVSRQTMTAARQETANLNAALTRLRESSAPFITAPIPDGLHGMRASIAEAFTHYAEFIDAECREILSAGNEISFGQLARMSEMLPGYMQLRLEALTAQLAGWDQDVRATLSFIANAVDEGE